MVEGVLISRATRVTLVITLYLDAYNPTYKYPRTSK